MLQGERARGTSPRAHPEDNPADPAVRLDQGEVDAITATAGNP